MGFRTRLYQRKNGSFCGSASCDDEGDVVVLLGGAEALDLFDDGCEGVFRGHGFVLL